MNLQVMFGNPIKGSKKKPKKGKSMAKKRPMVKKARKKSRKNPQDFISERGVHHVVDGRIATSAELANMRRTIADAKKNKAGAKVIQTLEADYEAAKAGVKNVLGKRKTASHYGFNKFKTRGLESGMDKKAVEKSIKRNLASKKMKELLEARKKSKKGAKKIVTGLAATNFEIEGGDVGKPTRRPTKKAASKKVTKKVSKKKASSKKVSKKKTAKKNKKVEKLDAAIKPIKKRRTTRKASKKVTKKAASKKVTKKAASKKVTKKAASKKVTKKAASKKATRKAASKKKVTKKVTKKATKKVTKKAASKKRNTKKVNAKPTPKKAKTVRRGRKKAATNRRKVSRRTSSKSVRKNPIGGNMANKFIAKTEAFTSKNLGHKLAEAAGLFGGGAAISGVQHILNVPAVKAVADKLDTIPYLGPVLKKNLDVLTLLGLGVAGLKLSKNPMVKDAAKGLVGASMVSLGARSYNTGVKAMGSTTLPLSATTLNGIKAVPNFGAIKFDAPSFGAIKEATEFGGVIDRPAMFADALANSYVDSTYEMEPESDF